MDAARLFSAGRGRWLTALAAPGLALLVALSAILWFEYQSNWVARTAGTLLLRGNAARPEAGAVWEGILASRQTRDQLRASPDANLDWQALPEPVQRHRYWEERRHANAVVLRMAPRARPLESARLSEAYLPELARSLASYQLGTELLQLASLRHQPFQAHATIQARIALEDGSLFPQLHRRLRARDAAEAWSFVHMSAADQVYWQDRLAAALRSVAAVDTTGLSGPVAGALSDLLQTWADSLHAAELALLRDAWQGGAGCQLHVVRDLDTFAGYAVAADGLPLPFQLPGPATAQLLRLSPSPEAAP